MEREEILEKIKKGEIYSNHPVMYDEVYPEIAKSKDKEFLLEILKVSKC